MAKWTDQLTSMLCYGMLQLLHFMSQPSSYARLTRKTNNILSQDGCNESHMA